MTPDDPNARPTRTFAADPASGDPPPDHTRTFAADPSATASFAVSAPPPLAGPVPGWPAALTRYQPLHPLGSGGMGLVYLCHDRQLDRQVAVKLSGGGRSADRTELLLREARSAARLHHPNICPVFDAAVSDGVPYLTMAYIDGPTLADELKRCGPCPPDAAARLVRTVAEAMQYAHDQGVVHRDLKPSNILLTPEREPIVTDFGLAVRTDLDATTSTISGTPHYMAPEQAAGDAANIGPRSDVFALGVILFEMLVGRPPFGGSAREVLSKVQREAVPPVRQLRPDVPKTLERLVAKATARNPKDRFPHMTAFADALTGFLRQPAKTGGGLGKAFLIVAVSAAVVFLLIALACGIGLLLPAMQKMRNAANQPQPAQLNDRALQKTIRALTDDAERLRESRDLEAALSQLDQAVRLAPGQPEPRRERAELLEEMGRLDDALADWTECVRLDPGEHGYRGKRADVLLELKRYREALADLDVAVRLLGEEESGDRTWLFVLRAEASHALGDHPAALADLKVVTDRDPVDNPFGEGANAYYLRARVKSALGDSAGAAADLTAAKRHADDLKPRYRAQLDR